ncbi:tyrosine-type recombinase/integrase [uncultured Zobellia sp.]|uniref:tyrosine-type recombinase/integrase n=1 Tax=uncultured Zobellia sp. TaxID=255433 RepID=UPI0025930034|nr:tyrosine-type recombinase/integrase [uncultured Zobellia sp.]
MGISLVLVKGDKKTVNGLKVSPVEVKYSYLKNYKRFSTQVFVQDKYWKNGLLSNRCPKYSVNQSKINKVIRGIENVISEITDNDEVPTVDLVKSHYLLKFNTQVKKQPIVRSFWSSYEIFLKEKEMYSRGYTKTLKTLKFQLKDFEESSKLRLTFDYILYGSFESDFKNHCLIKEIPLKNNEVVKTTIGLSNNYINKLFSNLKIFLSFCKNERIIKETKRFKTLKTVSNDVLVYLNGKEVQKLFDYKKYDYPNTFEGSTIIKDFDKNSKEILRTNKELISDIFCFQCSIGCRWGDIHKLKVNMFKIEKGFFVWTMEKTKHIVRVPENPISVGIFKKYSKGKRLNQFVFPKYSSQKFNKHLKEIGKDLNFNRIVKREIMVGQDLRKDSTIDKFTWELLSSHSGRRSFVKNLLDLGTMDNWSIMKLSGHKSINSFQKYVSVNLSDLSKGSELYSSSKSKTDMDSLVKELKKLPREQVLEIFSRIFSTQ